MGRGVVLVAALLSAALASACTPSDPRAQSPTPAPSPTFSCSTATVSDPCTAEKAPKEREQAAAIAAATTAYMNFLAEYIRVTRAGGADSATTAMRANAAGPYLSLYSGYIRRVKARGWRYSGNIESLDFTYSSGEHRSESPASELVFKYCQDGRENKITKAGRIVGHGFLVAGRIYVRQVDGTWKLWDSSEEEVSACEERS